MMEPQMDQPLLVLTAEDLDQAADALADKGWVVLRDAFSPSLVGALRADLRALQEKDLLAEAGVGRGDDHLQAETIRRDLIHWITGRSTAERSYLAQMEALRLSLNRRLFLGLFEFEASFAVYPPGAFYKRHMDSFKGAANRIVSAVTYLNEGWGASDGGDLRLFDGTGHHLAEIRPEGGTLVLFLSEEIPHEVAVTYRTRLSIAGWYRVNASVSDAVDPPA